MKPNLRKRDSDGKFIKGGGLQTDRKSLICLPRSTEFRIFPVLNDERPLRDSEDFYYQAIMP